MLLLGTAPLRGQPFDPPDTDYANGNQAEDPDFLRTVPVEPAVRAYLPASVDLSYRLPEPGNQGASESCTAWSAGYAARSYYTSRYEARDTRDPKNVPSPNFVYNMSWRQDQNGACNKGSRFSNVLAVLKRGAPSLADYPYRESDCSAPPPATVARATDFRVEGLRRIDHSRLDDVKGALARSDPVLISFHDDKAWHRHRGAGVFSQVAIDQETGWHAMAVIGYDERKQAFRLINSWGKGWGDGGYGWVSYDVFKARVREAETLWVVPTRPAPPVALQRPPSPARPQPNVAELRPPPPPPPVPVRPAPGPMRPPAVTQVQPPPGPVAPPQPAPVRPQPSIAEVRPAPPPQPLPVRPAPSPVQPPAVTQVQPAPAPHPVDVVIMPGPMRPPTAVTQLQPAPPPSPVPPQPSLAEVRRPPPGPPVDVVIMPGPMRPPSDTQVPPDAPAVAPAPTPPAPAQPSVAEVQPAPAPPAAVTPAPAPPPPSPPAVAQVQPAPAPEPARPHTLADLAALTCGKISPRREGNGNILDGYVGSDTDLDLVKAIAADVPDTTVGNVLLAPWPQCEAIQTLERQLVTPDKPGLDLGPTDQLHAGDTLHVTVQSPGQISYLYVSYVQADGSVVHLVQPAGLVPQPTLPNQTLRFGDGQGGGAKFTIGPPFGREMIIVIASRSPLFDHALPAQQTERDYLSELRRALLYKPSPDLPDRELSASIRTLQTEAN